MSIFDSLVVLLEALFKLVTCDFRDWRHWHKRINWWTVAAIAIGVVLGVAQIMERSK